MVKAIKLTATAHYLPSRVVTNDELSQLMDTSDEWIQVHTGIKTRHFAIGEDTSDMALKVARELLATAGLAPTQIDLIIVSTITPDAFHGGNRAGKAGRNECVRVRPLGGVRRVYFCVNDRYEVFAGGRLPPGNGNQCRNKL